MIDTITNRNFYLKYKENNENVMAAQVFWAVFFPADGRAQSAQQLIPPPIFSMTTTPFKIHLLEPSCHRKFRYLVCESFLIALKKSFLKIPNFWAWTD